MLNYLEESGAFHLESKKHILKRNVSDTMKLTSMQSKPTIRTSEQIGSQWTLLKLMPKMFPNMTSSAQDSHSNRSLSQEKDWALKIQGELSFLKSQGLLKEESHKSFSLKMLKGYYHTIKGEHLQLSLPHLMNWGIMQNGRCLTASILESHKIGKGCLLSDILEEKVADRYFLSPTKIQKLIREKSYQNRLATHSGQIIPMATQTKPMSSKKRESMIIFPPI